MPITNFYGCPFLKVCELTEFSRKHLTDGCLVYCYQQSESTPDHPLTAGPAEAVSEYPTTVLPHKQRVDIYNSNTESCTLIGLSPKLATARGTASRLRPEAMYLLTTGSTVGAGGEGGIWLCKQ